MNVYLDIDGVLLINETSLANYADEFLQTILEKYPDSTYWLMTQNLDDQKRAKVALVSLLKPKTITLLDKVKETKWEELKTEAINFDEDFIWFDDDLWPDEFKVLENKEAAEQFILVKLNEDPDTLKKLSEVVKANGQHL